MEAEGNRYSDFATSDGTPQPQYVRHIQTVVDTAYNAVLYLERCEYYRRYTGYKEKAEEAGLSFNDYETMKGFLIYGLPPSSI